VPYRLSRARAYWRLAAKADKAGNHAQAKDYRTTGDRIHAEYLREKEAQERAAKMRQTGAKPCG
jgi:RecA-family ATPase